jgi:uncharacterized protein
MKTFYDIKKIIEQYKDELKRDFGVTNIGVFGSYVRGEQKEQSDIDVLIEFEQTPGFVKFMQLEKRLSEVLGVKTEIVTKKALKPYIGRQILQEVQYV